MATGVGTLPGEEEEARTIPRASVAREERAAPGLGGEDSGFGGGESVAEGLGHGEE
jgi:hypothetical protein